MPSPGSGPGGRMSHDHALHPAMPFDGTPEVIDPRRKCQHEFKVLAGGQGYPLLKGVNLRAGIGPDLDPVFG